MKEVYEELDVKNEEINALGYQYDCLKEKYNALVKLVSGGSDEKK